MGLFLTKTIPARTVAQAIKTIDSYALLQGACPEMYQRMPSPAVCIKNAIMTMAVEIMMIHLILNFGISRLTK